MNLRYWQVRPSIYWETALIQEFSYLCRQKGSIKATRYYRPCLHRETRDPASGHLALESFQCGLWIAAKAAQCRITSRVQITIYRHCWTHGQAEGQTNHVLRAFCFTAHFRLAPIAKFPHPNKTEVTHLILDPNNSMTRKPLNRRPLKFAFLRRKTTNEKKKQPPGTIASLPTS